jgi:hypothetical protein
LQEFFAAELVAEPGSRHQYANANYIVLAAIVEQVSGQPYESYLRQQFWDPLGMDHTGYQQRPPASAQLARGYTYDLDEGAWKDWGTTDAHLPDREQHWFSIGKGDLYSTTEDLYRWHRALMDHEVLEAASVAQMETPWVAENASGQSFYGYGWAIFENSKGSKIVTHNGSNRIYFADFVRDVDEDTVVIVLSNVRLGNDSESVAWHIAGMLWDEHYQPSPVARLGAEVVYAFTRTHGPESAAELIPVLERESGRGFSDKRLFNTLGFRMMRKEPEPGWGLELLKLNTQQFPDDGNLWDSLGEAYFEYGSDAEAAACFEQAILRSTHPDDHWLENAREKRRLIGDNRKGSPNR